jgi:hypothetical protein
MSDNDNHGLCIRHCDEFSFGIPLITYIDCGTRLIRNTYVILIATGYSGQGATRPSFSFTERDHVAVSSTCKPKRRVVISDLTAYCRTTTLLVVRKYKPKNEISV